MPSFSDSPRIHDTVLARYLESMRKTLDIY